MSMPAASGGASGGAPAQHMRLRVIATTAQGPWRPWLMSLCRPDDPDAVETWRWPRADDARPLPELAPGTRCLVLVVDPAQALAAAFEADPALDIGASLRAWCAGARMVLRAAHRQPRRFVFIEAGQLLAAPDALGPLLQSWALSLPNDAERRPAPVGPSAAWVLVAERLVSADPEAGSLRQELLASCVDVAPAAPPLAAAWAAGHEAAQALAALRRDALAAGDLRESLRRRQDELADARTETRRLVADLRGREAALQSLQDAHVQRGEELKSERTEKAVVVEQVLQLQDELQRQLRQARDRERSALFGVAVDWPTPVVGRPRRRQVSDRPPHRHLEFELASLQSGGRRVAPVTVRLIEHQGRPGLAFLAPPNGHRPLAAWQVHGREGERELMLMVPGDEPGRRLLERLGTADWWVVNAVALALQRTLAGSGAEADTRWRVLAARLCAQLREMPARLRYDAIEAASPHAAPDTIELRFLRTVHGDRAIGTLTLLWHAGGPGLQWVAADPCGPPPLAGWPVQEDGRLQAQIDLTSATGATTGAALAWWRGWSAPDRELLRALADAVPAAAAALDRDAGLAAHRAAFAADAERFARRSRGVARRLVLSSAARSVWRRLSGHRGSGAA